MDEEARQFIEAVRDDPYAHMVTHMYLDAWALGYESALREHGLTRERLRRSFGDRRRQAMEQLLDSRQKAEAKLIIALAQTGRLLSRKPEP